MGNNTKLRRKRWMSYDAARLTVQQEAPEVRSRKQYWQWHKKHRPVGLPVAPNRVYLKEWKDWADFLGTENTFEKNPAGSYRPFWEAVRFVQSKRFKIKPEYKEAYERGEIPKDIPKAPEKYYKDEWVSWRHWLGVDLEHKLEAARQEVAVFAIIHPSGMPVGYIGTMLAERGMSEMKDKLKTSGDRPYKIYKWEKEHADRVKAILRRFASPQDDHLWLASNVHALLFELDNLLEWAT